MQYQSQLGMQKKQANISDNSIYASRFVPFLELEVFSLKTKCNMQHRKSLQVIF